MSEILDEIMQLIEINDKEDCDETLIKISDLITKCNAESGDNQIVLKLKGRVIRKHTNLPGDYGMIVKKEFGELIQHDVELIIRDLGKTKKQIHKLKG